MTDILSVGGRVTDRISVFPCCAHTAGWEPFGPGRIPTYTFAVGLRRSGRLSLAARAVARRLRFFLAVRIQPEVSTNRSATLWLLQLVAQSLAEILVVPE